MQAAGRGSVMTKEGAHTAILTSALIVGGTYAVRKLIEPAATVARHPPKNLVEGVLQVSGAEPAPANVAQFATGFGFTYMTLAVFATFTPAFAGSMAVLIAVSNTIINGGAIFTDISQQVEGSETEKPAAKPAKMEPAKAKGR